VAARPPLSCYTLTMPRCKLTEDDRQEILDLWRSGESYLEISKQFNIAKNTVGRVLSKFGVSQEERAERMIHRGEKSGRWKGGRMIDVNGYVKVTIHPGSICYDSRDANNRVYEHRIVMSEHIGRPLLSHENVHHKNGDRQDNRIENLELWSKMQPQGQSVDDKVKFAIEILSIYRPEILCENGSVVTRKTVA